MTMNEKKQQQRSSNKMVTVKVMCRYGGKIQPRIQDHQLTYIGGDTKILTVDRNINFSDIVSKIQNVCDLTTEVCLKYQLPGEDLDSLVSVFDDDDVRQMMVEHDQLLEVSQDKPVRVRLFLFSLNRPAKLGLDTPFNPDYLFGFDKDYDVNASPTWEIPKIHDMGLKEIPGSDPRKGAKANTESTEHMSCDGFVTRVVYPMVGVVRGYVNQERIVYNFVPSMPTVPENMNRRLMSNV